jgi:site-specific DNA recombinase
VTESSRCAIYARFSSEKQNPLSTEQQIRKCREYTDKHAMYVLDEHIYANEAISGDTDNRVALQQFLAAARQKPRPFDVLLVEDTSCSVVAWSIRCKSTSSSSLSACV